MNIEEAKKAILKEQPIQVNGINYDCIKALIYRYNRETKKWNISAELKDKNNNSITIAQLSKIKAL